MIDLGRILLAAIPESEHFAMPYARALGCDMLITNAPGDVWSAESRYSVVWLEWGRQFAAQVLTRRLSAFMVVRVHDYEIRTQLVSAINWQHVDLVWFVNRRAQEDFNRLVRCHALQLLLPNAVDPADFECCFDDAKHIGMLSIAAATRKRYDRAIALMKLLPEHQLTIRTAYDANAYELMRRAGPNVHFDFRRINGADLPEKSDVVAFFRGKSHVLSTSDHEAFHYAVAEGALCGLVPAVFEWEWGYPGDFWDPYVQPSLEALAEHIRVSMPGPEHRGYVTDRFSANVLAPRLIEAISKSMVQPA